MTTTTLSPLDQALDITFNEHDEASVERQEKAEALFETMIEDGDGEEAAYRAAINASTPDRTKRREAEAKLIKLGVLTEQPKTALITKALDVVRPGRRHKSTDHFEDDEALHQAQNKRTLKVRTVLAFFIGAALGIVIAGFIAPGLRENPATEAWAVPFAYLAWAIVVAFLAAFIVRWITAGQLMRHDKKEQAEKKEAKRAAKAAKKPEIVELKLT